jgi:hypothetical protein
MGKCACLAALRDALLRSAPQGEGRRNTTSLGEKVCTISPF